MRFRSRGLAVLDRILQFVGGQVLIQDLAMSSIEPVWDLSRLGELSSIETDREAGGYFQIGEDNVHAGTGDVVTNATIGVYTEPPLSASWGRTGERWVWLIRWGVQTDIAIQGAQFTLGIRPLGSAFAQRDLLIEAWGATTVAIANAGSLGNCAVSTHRQLEAPVLIPPGRPLSGALGFRSQSGAAAGAGTIRLSTVCWVGPIGVYPPGYA